MADMVPIRFTKPSLPYNAGDIAWFNEVQAAAYIKQGFAVRDKSAGAFKPGPARAALVEASTTAPDHLAIAKAVAAANAPLIEAVTSALGRVAPASPAAPN